MFVLYLWDKHSLLSFRVDEPQYYAFISIIQIYYLFNISVLLITLPLMLKLLFLLPTVDLCVAKMINLITLT